VSVAAADEVVDVVLKDGGTLRLRPARPADKDALVEFFARLSDRSRYLRFHGIRRVDGELVDPFLADGSQVGTLVGTLEGRIVALASFARLEDGDTAEMAFAVADEEQGRGIGTRLLEQLASRARRIGIHRFVADVMAENRQALAVFADAGFEVTQLFERGEVELRFPIEATEALRTEVEKRDHDAVVASLRPFFAPQVVAVVGASSRRGSIGGELFRNVLDAGFAGVVHPVNRGGNPVAGVRGYRSVEETPDRVELAVICVPALQVLDAAEDALAAGVRALCVISSGFAEVGPAGGDRQQALLSLVRAHGARLVGPNCLGISSAAVGLNATFAPNALPPGRIGFSSQSGALGLALLEQAAERQLGFSSFVSVGNKADVSSNDLLEWWEDDEGTDAILLYLESFGNPRKFGRIARRVAHRKPIIALKAGATAAGAHAASSHTAALAGSDAAADALFRQAGVIRARTLEELVDVSALLSTQPLPRGRRVAVVTNAGGLGILCADACASAGLILPGLADATRNTLAEALPAEASTANPVDLLGSATEVTYEAAVPPLLADPGIDALIVLFVPPVIAGAEEVAAAILRIVESVKPEKPVLACVISRDGTPAAFRARPGAVATFAYPESAARALGIAAERAEWLRRPPVAAIEPVAVGTARARSVIDEALAGNDDAWLDAAGTRSLLEAYEIPIVAEREAETVDAAVAAAVELGFPVVVKTAEPGAHKTERGGVALDLGDEQSVRAAVEAIGLPVLVQPFVRMGTELLAGIVQDPVFGPLVAFGPGGVLAELIGDAGLRLAPVTRAEAEELVYEGKAGRLVRGFRGAPAADAVLLTDLLVRLSRLADDFPEIAELDLNPVLARPDGCFAVDARIRVRVPPLSHSTKGW
jgi:acetyl coenzyme A synthetase (ADP forming)-like protein